MRKAVSEAVGWRWYGMTVAAVDKSGQTRFGKVYIDWDDALAACQAAGFLSGEYFAAIGDDACSIHAGEWGPIADSKSGSPESLCKALLKALAAKGGAA